MESPIKSIASRHLRPWPPRPVSNIPPLATLSEPPPSPIDFERRKIISLVYRKSISLTAVRIIDRYLVGEIGRTWLAVTAILLLVTVGLALANVLADVAGGKVPAEVLFRQLGLKCVEALTVLIPLSFFLSVMLAFGRLHRDSEMPVLAASGLGRGDLYRPIAYLVAPMALVLLALALWTAPWATRTSRTLIAQAASEVSLAGLKAGRFHEIAQHQGVVYVETLDRDGRFTNAFIHLQRDGRKDVVIAARGYQYQDPDGARFLALIDGFRSEGVPGQADYRLMEFERNDVRLPDPSEARAELKLGALPLATVLGGETAAHAAELQWRLAPALALAVLALLAVPLARTTPRQGYYGNLIIAILVYVIYANALAIARAWVEDGALPVAVGLWWVHAAGVGAALWMARNPGARRGTARRADARL